MKFFDKIKSIFGRKPKVEKFEVPDPVGDLDRGPCTRKYLRRYFPNSVFTQRVTRARKATIRRALLKLRPDQRELVYRLGWNKGVRV